MRPHLAIRRKISATQTIVLWFTIAVVPIAIAVALITPGHGHHVSYEEVDAAVLIDASVVEDMPGAAARGPSPIVGGAIQIANPSNKSCEDVLWSSLKGKCLSFGRRIKQHRRVQSTAYFWGR
jgi:hypothetical protein